jgi:GT2 family glycosyltransferase
MTFSVIMVQYNSTPLTIAALESWYTFHGDAAEVILVDNGSLDPELDMIARRFPAVHVYAMDKNRGFGSANNRGAREAHGDVLLLLNNDVRITENVIDPIATHLRNSSSTGVLGVGLRNVDGSRQQSGGPFLSIWNEWQIRRGNIVDPGAEIFQRDWVSAAALAIRRPLFEHISGFDEGYFMYYEDIDLCRRAHNAGAAVAMLRSPSVVHLGGGSQPGGMPENLLCEYRRSQLRYYDTHTSASQRMLVRFYLAVKSGSTLVFSGDPIRKNAAGRILRLVFGRDDAAGD